MPAKKSEIRFKRILGLGPERMSAINTALAAGGRPRRIARTIQGEWKELTDVPPETLAKQLARYRAEIVPTLVVPVALGESGTQQPPGFHVHDQLRGAVEIHASRLDYWIEKEREIGFPIALVTDLIQTQAELLGALAKLQFELGILEYKGPVGRCR